MLKHGKRNKSKSLRTLDVLIGLEIHTELKTSSKMFCWCPNPSGDLSIKPNTTICPICVGHPGTLPVLNLKGVEWTILAGLALGCKIARHSKFDRKHYFYPDLPKGFQISQYADPFASEGRLEVGGREIDIIRIHIEEDTGKLIHEDGVSLIDYNRSGVPLMELVSAPQMRGGAEARAFAQNYRQILRVLDISDADMEKGQMRIEANISLQSHGAWKFTDNFRVAASGSAKLNPKVEIKNLNSFKSVELAIDYEILRQHRLLESGQGVQAETRGWDEAKLVTKSQRTKEEAMDYRYFPEPDIPPIVLRDEYIKEIEGKLPELPKQKFERFLREYGLSPAATRQITENLDFANQFEKVMSELQNLVEGQETEQDRAKLAKITSNWLLNNLSGLLQKSAISWEECKIKSEDFAEFIYLIVSGGMTTTVAKSVLLNMVKTGEDPHKILDSGEFEIEEGIDLDSLAKEILSSSPEQVAQYKKGKKTLIQFFVGEMMKRTKGKADPKEVLELFRDKLN